MSAVDLLRILQLRWLTVVILSILGTAGGIALTVVTPKTYSATTELYVSVQAADSSTAGEVGQGSTAAQQKVKSYAEVATSTRVLLPVIESLHLDLTPSALASKITTKTPAGSVIMQLSASDRDPARAATIANAVGESFRSVVVDSLEKPTGGGPALVRIESIQKATAPTSPITPRPRANIAVGIALGFSAGLGVAMLRSILDTKIRNENDVEGATGHSVIGGVGFDPTATKRPLIVQLDPRSPRAESFRALRTNLQFIDAGARARRFLLTSAMPSEGKTTTAANLAIAIAESGARVLLIDADLRRPRLAEVMGLEGAVGLTDVLIGRAEIDDVVQPWGHGSLSVMPAGQLPPNPSELLGSRGMQALMDMVDHLYDYVVLDTPPLLPVTDAAVLSKLTDGAIIVAAAGRSKRTQLEKAAANLDHLGSRVIGVVITMLPLRGPNRYGQGQYGSYYGQSPDPDSSRRFRYPFTKARVL